MTLNEALGRTLRRLRQEQKRTLDSVSRPAGISLGHLSGIERGVRSPSLDVLWSLCSALNVPAALVCREVDDLMGAAVDTTNVERELEV